MSCGIAELKGFVLLECCTRLGLRTLWVS